MRARKAFVVCYQDSCPDLEERLGKLSPDSYAYILHNLDVDANGELKKPHYHVYLEFENAREFSVLGEALGCGENNVERVKNTKGCIRYLVHADSPEKAQYNREDIVLCNLDIEKYFRSDTESDKVYKVLSIISELREDEEKHHAFGDVVNACCAAGCYDVLRRGQTLYLQVWKNG